MANGMQSTAENGANHSVTTTRRAVVRSALAAGAAVTLAAPAGAVPAPDPDAELLALIETQISDLAASCVRNESEAASFGDAWWNEVYFPRVERIRAIPARTVRGLAAKLRWHFYDHHMDLAEDVLGGPETLDCEVASDLCRLMKEAEALAAALGEPPVPGGVFHG